MNPFSIPSLTSSEIRNWSRSVFPFLALGRWLSWAMRKTNGSRIKIQAFFQPFRWYIVTEVFRVSKILALQIQPDLVRSLWGDKTSFVESTQSASDKASKQFQIHKSRSLCRTASLRPWIPWHLNKTCMRCDSAKNRSNTNSKVLSKQPRMLWHWHAIQVGFSGWKVDERLVFSWTLLGLSHRTTSPGSVVATLLL